MSHFTVLVVLPATEPDGVPAALAAALAPFDENRETEPRRVYLEDASKEYGLALEYYGEHPDRKPALLDELDMTAVLSAYKGETVSVDVGEGGKPDLYYTMTTYNPQSKWDWYSVGGRWSGYFVHRADSDRDRRLVTGEKSWANEGKPRELFHCDGGPRELLDFAAQRDAAGIRAAEQYDKWAALTEGLPEGQSWMSFLERYEAAPDAYPIDRARDDYHAQPAYRAASASEDFRWFDDVIGYFAHSRDEHIAAARNSAVPGYALLALDGTWVGPGEMGWFGMSSDTESSRALYHEQANAYLDTLPGDAIIVAVDCHI